MNENKKCCEKCWGRVQDENGFGRDYGCQNESCPNCHAQPGEGRVQSDAPLFQEVKVGFQQVEAPQPSEGWEERFVESGAALEHDRWARWQHYFFSKCNLSENDGVLVTLKLPTELFERWKRQIKTPYSELSGAEKESDRKETRNYLPLIASEIDRAKNNKAPMGVSQWRNHGQEFGYWKFFEKESRLSTLREIEEWAEGEGFKDPNEAGQFALHAAGYNEALDDLTYYLKSKIAGKVDIQGE